MFAVPENKPRYPLKIWFQWKGSLFLIPLALLGGACSSGSDSVPGLSDNGAPPPFPTGILNVGHGGAKDLCPANTLECFQLALDQGANALEVDLQVLGDGTLVTFHDGNTEDQTGVDARIEEMTLAELKELDAGWGFSPDNGATHPFRGQGMQVPTFEEFLAAFHLIPVLLDVKVDTQSMADALLPYARDRFDANARRFVYIKTHDVELTETLRGLDPPVQVAFNTRDRILMVVLPDRVEHLAPTWVDLNPEFLFPWAVEWTEERGHILTVSTIDEAEEMEAYLAMEKVDGIVTNRPDLLRDLLNQ
jgi:glycerophosphoryl diester phosphodiesterase